MLHRDLARKCFEENLQLFAHPQAHPEKYNLYKGLAALAKATKEIQDELRSLRSEIQHLKR